MFWHNDLGFRPVEKKDLELLRQLRNDPSTWIYLSDVTQISPEMQERWFEGLTKAKDKAYFAVFKEQRSFPVSFEGDFLGMIRTDELDHNNRSIRVGCDIVPAERGKGYGTKTFEAILKFCFDHMGMHRVWLLTLEDNAVAIKLYKKVGFQEEGRNRQAMWRNGKWRDYIVMSILEDEYKKIHGT